MEWIFVKTLFLLFSIFLRIMHVKGLAVGVCKTQLRREGDSIKHVVDCCFNFYKQNGECVECPIGHSSKGIQCEKCVNGQFGRKCAELCQCKPNESCHHVRGCITVTVEDGTEPTNPQLNGNPAEQASGHDDVVTYMTCVAVGSVLVVVCGLLVKNREAICRRNGTSMTAMKNEITKRKRQSVSSGKNSGKDKKESLYAEINEKYMINFDGE
ncbi:uncharacterized protein LOC134696278 [Mytilus trossulus]|uniref:uncharacterized protein LOC134696278 n=1 Tax=Mytilus trossulus TaxID=6551 RepID=UPI003003E4D9